MNFSDKHSTLHTVSAYCHALRTQSHCGKLCGLIDTDKSNEWLHNECYHYFIVSDKPAETCNQHSSTTQWSDDLSFATDKEATKTTHARTVQRQGGRHDTTVRIVHDLDRKILPKQCDTFRETKLVFAISIFVRWAGQFLGWYLFISFRLLLFSSGHRFCGAGLSRRVPEQLHFESRRSSRVFCQLYFILQKSLIDAIKQFCEYKEKILQIGLSSHALTIA